MLSKHPPVQTDIDYEGLDCDSRLTTNHSQVFDYFVAAPSVSGGRHGGHVQPGISRKLTAGCPLPQSTLCASAPLPYQVGIDDHTAPGTGMLSSKTSKDKIKTAEDALMFREVFSLHCRVPVNVGA